MQVIARLGCPIFGPGLPQFVRPLDIHSAQTTCAGSGQVVVVRGYQRHLLGLQVEHARYAQVGLRAGFVGLEHLSAQHAVPRWPGALGHVGEQADVAVGQRGDGEACLEPREAFHAVGPGIEPVPHMVEVASFGVRQLCQAKARQDLVEDASVQVVDQCPALLAPHHTRHGGLVAGAPRQRKRIAIHGGVQRLHLAHDAAVPVDHGAKDVERQHLHGAGDVVCCAWGGRHSQSFKKEEGRGQGVSVAAIAGMALNLGYIFPRFSKAVLCMLWLQKSGLPPYLRFFFLLFFSPSPCLVYLLRPAVACRCSVSPVVAMTAPLSSTSIAATPTDDRTLVRAVLALGVGGFSIGTGEFVIMGLLPEVARDIGVSIPQAGHVISAYALGVVVGAPVLAVLCAHWGRRALLMALMVVYALGNFASALAPGYGSLSAMRLFTGLPHGTYFGVAALVAAALAPQGRRARAVGWVMLRLTTATLVGVPIAAALGEHFGWRAAFVFVGLIAVAAVVMVRLWVPAMPASHGASPLRELGALARKQVWFTLGIGAIGFGGMFAVFSYIKPTLIEVAGMPPALMPFVLSLFGLGMVVGNIVGSRMADKALMPAVGKVLVWSILVLALFVPAAHHPASAALATFFLGTLVAIGPALQIRLMDVAGDAQTLAAALNHSAFNAANALGAWLGGVGIAAGLGWTSTGWVGVLLGLGGVGMFAWALVSERNTRRVAA